MAFLSLGLQNDEPPISSDQGEKKPSLPKEIGHTPSDARPDGMQNSAEPQSASGPPAAHSDISMSSFLTTHSENGNGHRPSNPLSVSNPESDDFDDHFDDADFAHPTELIQGILSGEQTAPGTNLSAAPNNGNGRAGVTVPPQTLSDKNVRPTRLAADQDVHSTQAQSASGNSDRLAPALPPSVEQLRRKLAEEEKLRAARVGPAPLAASVDSLSSSERQWVPTFSTFKFGYLPGRGLLYSTIGHEVAIFGLFLLITYVLPTLHPERLIPRENVQDHTIVLKARRVQAPGRALRSSPRPHPRGPAKASPIPDGRRFSLIRRILRTYFRQSSVLCWCIPSRFANSFLCPISFKWRRHVCPAT